MSDIEFAQGIYFNKPHEKAPDFVLGSISIRSEVFSEWLAQQKTSERGYVRLKINVGKESGKPYVAVDDWKPEEGSREAGQQMERGGPNLPPSEADWDSDIPFMRKEY